MPVYLQGSPVVVADNWQRGREVTKATLRGPPHAAAAPALL
jgi:hypothetical protein